MGGRGSSLEVAGTDRVVARWRLEGTLMLPWRPLVKVGARSGGGG